MAGIFHNETDDERRKRLFFESAPPDPTQQAKKAGMGHFNRSLHDVLMPQSAMPIGPHTGMLMERVPADYLAWVQAQPWAAHWHPWHPVADYLARFPNQEQGTRNKEHLWPSHIVFVSPMQACAPSKDWHHPQHALLTCHPDTFLHEDKYHTFALGALGLRPVWYDAKLKAYRLTAQKRWQAIQAGAAEVKSRNTGASHLTFERVDASGQTRCTKHCYATEHEAQVEITRILTSRRRHRPDYLRAYECPRCRFWHLTRQKLPHES